MLARVGTDLAYGIHGLRVTGYNLCKQARGAEVAAAHGLWQPQSHSRYARFDLVRDIFTFGIIPSAPREFPSAGEAELQCAHLAAHPAGTVHALFAAKPKAWRRRRIAAVIHIGTMLEHGSPRNRPPSLAQTSKLKHETAHPHGFRFSVKARHLESRLRHLRKQPTVGCTPTSTEGSTLPVGT